MRRGWLGIRSRVPWRGPRAGSEIMVVTGAVDWSLIVIGSMNAISHSAPIMSVMGLGGRPDVIVGSPSPRTASVAIVVLT